MKKALINKINIFSIPLLTLILFACSNSQESKLVYTESNTIKQNVIEKKQDITWTQTIEGERLSQVINRNSMQLGADVQYSKDLYKISNKSAKPVYPSFSDFGSLDTSHLRLSAKQKLVSFCTALSSENHNGAEEYFYGKYIFNYVFFIEDLHEGWKTHFDSKIPEDSEIFTKWVFGEPFNGADIIQIPVRFYADCGTIDMTLFLNAKGSNEIYQISIDRWQKV